MKTVPVFLQKYKSDNTKNYNLRFEHTIACILYISKYFSLCQKFNNLYTIIIMTMSHSIL